MKFATAVAIRDLMWYDGPLLSLFEQDGKKYLVMWVDVEEEHKWFAIEVETATLQDYYDLKVTLRQVMEKSSAIYIGIGQFIGEHGKDCPLILFKDLPEDDLPTTDSFYHANNGLTA